MKPIPVTLPCVVMVYLEGAPTSHFEMPMVTPSERLQRGYFDSEVIFLGWLAYAREILNPHVFHCFSSTWQ